MKAYIVTDSTSYEPRALLIRDLLLERGFDTELVLSDFSHTYKKKRTDSVQGAVYLDAGSYSRNISAERLIYHRSFARKAYAYLRERDMDLLYVLLPGNSLAPSAVRLKREKGCRLFFDLIDLWPESLPLKGISWLPPVRYWKSLRERYINQADTIITECSLYKEKAALDSSKTHTLYWIKPEQARPISMAAVSKPAQQGIDAAYIGSINNIIDIAAITGILKELGKRCPVRLHVIGDGENRDTFLRALDAAGTDYKYYGSVYDEERKERILRQCSWGLNIMKPQVSVGLTMKSIEYMANGLRLVNSIPGDTWRLVGERGIGVNISGSCSDTAERILGFAGADSREIYELYLSLFTRKSAEELLDRILRGCCFANTADSM